MLVVSRKVNEAVLIGDSIRVVIVRQGNGQVRLGIEAPRELVVIREELAEAEPPPGEQAAVA